MADISGSQISENQDHRNRRERRGRECSDGSCQLSMMTCTGSGCIQASPRRPERMSSNNVGTGLVVCFFLRICLPPSRSKPHQVPRPHAGWVSSRYIFRSFFSIFDPFSSPFLTLIPFHSINIHITLSHSFPSIPPPVPQDAQSELKTIKKTLN